MAEPTTTTAGAGLTAVFIAAFGPAFGEYAVVVFAALAGSSWPLSSRAGITRTQGAAMVLRLVLTASALTGVAAAVAQHYIGIQSAALLSPIAFGIAVLGDSWRDIISALAKRVMGKVAGEDKT